MFRSLRSSALLTAALVALVGPSVALPGAAVPTDVQPYIVVLTPAAADIPAAAAALARSAGGQVGHVYEHALKGFSLTAAPAAAAGLARNPLVAYVEPDRVVTLAAQETPTGIQRAFAAANAALDIDGLDDLRVDVDVAVIDTGIDWEHPDLNVVGGVNCAQGWPFGPATCSGNGDDDHYHGTHVAGTIGALDNGLGVVGMAPGASLWAVKVLNKRGSGYTSWIVGGIDWVAAHAGDIEVANMSLGGAGFSQAEYDAIQGAVDAGVAFAVAAGNEDDDANNYSPGGFDNVLSVSALADFNGAPGGGAAATCRADQDDTLADFSNWGPEVDVAAPGVCILSTYPLEQGSYGTISGTSMASPHAAGALALLASSANPSGATAVYNLYNLVKAAGNFNWNDDSGDGTQEPLLDVTTFSPALVSTGGTGNQAPTASFIYECNGLACTFNGSGVDPDGDPLTYSWSFGDSGTSTLEDPTHTYASGGTYAVALTVRDDDSATGTTSESVTVTAPAPGGAALSGYATVTGKTWMATVTLRGPSGSTTSGVWTPSGKVGGCTITIGDTCTFSLKKLTSLTASVTYTHTNAAVPAPDPSYVTIYSPMG
jgi:subtilisin family serine protease